MVPLRTRVAGRTGSMPFSILPHVSPTCRSHSVVRVPRSHNMLTDEGAPAHVRDVPMGAQTARVEG
jgi:hypothetical protein